MLVVNKFMKNARKHVDSYHSQSLYLSITYLVQGKFGLFKLFVMVSADFVTVNYVHVFQNDVVLASTTLRKIHDLFSQSTLSRKDKLGLGALVDVILEISPLPSRSAS